MPSVGMRRTTRVFGVVKGVDGARVLRSGRRLWPDFTEPKLRRPNYGDEWYPHPVIKKHNGPGAGGLKPKTPNGWAHVQSMKQKEEEEKVMESCEKEDEVIEEVSKKVEEEEEEQEEEEEEQVVASKDSMFGLVYGRKRKRNGGEEKSQDRMYGIRFSRRRRRMTGSGRLVRAFGVVFEGSCSGSGSGFLNLVLKYMKKERVQLPELASFLLSQPISGVFASRGIRFLWVCL